MKITAQDPADRPVLDGMQRAGVIYVQPGLSLELSDVEVTNGTSDDSSLGGGGILNAGNLSLTDVAIHHNQARAAAGGGLWNFCGTATLVRSPVYANAAEVRGGGIFNDGGSLSLVASDVYGNTAQYRGGGLFNFAEAAKCRSPKPGRGAVTVVGSSIHNNSARFGGGVLSFGGSLSLTRSNVTANVAPVYAGVFADADAAFTLRGGSVHDNRDSPWPAHIAASPCHPRVGDS
jgi:hypothetical protein